MDSVELFNIYVEKLVGSVTELTKTNIMLSAQLTFSERMLTAANQELEKVKSQLAAASMSAIINEPINEKKKKNTDTF